MRYGSLFSGIGGFDLGLDRAGMSCAWQVERDPMAAGVLDYRWPGVPKFDDVTTFGKGQAGGPVDLICGGFPCQDLSVAGRRAGLAGERSGLFYEFMRLAAEFAPRWIILENVPGLLSSDGGRDMAIVTNTLAGLGYGWAYRVLDSQYFGLAQRRRRVFIVCCLGDPARAAQVLFERDCLPGHSQPGGKAGAIASALTANGAGAGGGADDNSGQANHIIAQPLRAGRQFSDMGDGQSNVVVAYPDPAYTLADSTGTRTGSGRDAQDTFVIQQNGSDIQTNHKPGALTAGMARGTSGPVVFDTTQITSSGNYSNPQPGDPCHPLAAGAHPPAIAFTERGRDGGRQLEWQEGVAYALTSPGDGGRTMDRCIAYNWQSGGDVRHNFSEDNSPALSVSQVPAVGVRRLTPRECERLQGFPDDWTLWRSQNGERVEQSDSARYRQLGNAVSVPVAEWIARRIVEASQ